MIGATIDIPVAYLESFARDIRFKIDAKDTVNKEIATAAARLAAADSELVARAANSLIRKEFRYQKNKEEIVAKAIELLREEANETSQQAGSASQADALPDLDADWLNVFERYAENASTERLQLQWARILAGEICRPRSFSLKTLRFVSELNSYTANTFEKYTDFVFNTAFIPSSSFKSGQPLTELYHLQDFGLISGVGGTVSWALPFEKDTTAILTYCGKSVLLVAPSASSIAIESVLLTTTGKEILVMLRRQFHLEQLKSALDWLPKERFQKIQLVTHPVPQPDGRSVVSVELTLWQQPVSS